MMQRVGLIDNASGEEIHQGPHPFNAWSRHLCIKVRLPSRCGPVAWLCGAVLSGLSLSTVAQVRWTRWAGPLDITPVQSQTKGWNIHEVSFWRLQILHFFWLWWSPHLLFLAPLQPPSPHTSSYLFAHSIELWGENINPVWSDYQMCSCRGRTGISLFLLWLWPLKISQIKSFIIYEG